MRVRDVMTRNAECTQPNATLQEVATRMKNLNVGALPVCGDNDRLIGMVTDRDLTVRSTMAGTNPGTTHVQDVMTPNVVFCFEDQDVREASQLMQDHQIRRLVVLNRDKRLVGIVSLGDLAVEAGNDAISGNTLEAVSEPAEPNR